MIRLSRHVSPYFPSGHPFSYCCVVHVCLSFLLECKFSKDKAVVLECSRPSHYTGICYVKVKVAQSCPPLCDPTDYVVHGILQARILEWVAFPFSRGIFPTQGLNPGLPHCRRILYQMSHKGRPRILEWVAYPFSKGSSQPSNWTGVSCIAGGFFTSWPTCVWYLFMNTQKWSKHLIIASPFRSYL